MVQFQNNFVQDLTQKCRVRTDCGLVAFNADNLSNVVSVALYNGEEAYTGGGTVVGAVVCPDGATVALDGTLSGNVASITLTGDCFALQGQIGVSIQIVSGDVRTTVLKAIYNVDVSSTDTIVDPDSRITLSLAEIQAKLDEIPTILANAQTAIDGIEAQKDTMIASIASVAGQGTDTTLTQSGVAADAKATGDEVSALKSALNTGSIISKDWEQGSRGATGENTSPLWAARCTSANVYDVVPGAIVSVKNIDSGLKVVIAISNGTSFVYDSGWQTADCTYTVTYSTAGKALVNVAKVDGTDFTPSSISTLEFIVSPVSKTNELEKSFNALNNELNAVDWTATIVPNSGKYWYVNNTVLGLSEYSATTAFDKVRIKKGDQIRLKTTGLGIAPPYIITDANNNILASCETTSYDGILTISQNDARWLAVNAINTVLSTFELYMANNNSTAHLEKTIASLVNKDNLITNAFFRPVFQMVVGGSIDSTSGVYSYNASSTNFAADEYYYPLEDGAKYIFGADGINYNIYLYDANKTFVEAVRANNNMLSGQYVFTNSNNRKYFRVSCYRSGGMADYIKTLHVAMTYYPKKVVCLGDSMTAGNGASVAYHMYLARKTGWTCQNWGVSGSGYMNNMTTSTAVGGGVEGIATGGVVPEYDTDFVHAVEEIPNDADLYIVFGGYNDYNTNRTEAAFETAVGTVLSYIQNNMPTSRILTITPQQVYKSGERDGKTANSAGLTLKNYADSIKKVSSEHAVKCIDLYTESGLYPYSSANSSQNYQSDGLHPSNNGQRLIYQAIMNDVLAMMSQKY